MRILVVEDNPKMADALQRGLGDLGYSVDTSLTGFDGEDLAAAGDYDLIVLDLMLPDRDGIDVCRNLRRRGVKVPILMLTALSSTTETVRGLEAGADDYLTKPFEFAEFVARVRALLRRGEPVGSIRLRCGGLEMDLVSRSVRRDGKTIHLTAKEFALLECLLRSRDRVLTRTEIAEKVWGMDFEPSSNVIEVYVSTLRRKIDRDFDVPLIHTVVGVGYRLGEGPSGGRS